MTDRHAPTTDDGSAAHPPRGDRAPVASDRQELFAAAPVAEALQWHFEKHPSAFVALHAIGGAAARQHTAEVMAASGLARQTLTVRRDGIGTTLAEIGFVELPSGRGAPERVYDAHAECGSAARRPIADTLLAFSRLGVLLVGVAPADGRLEWQEEWTTLHDRLRAMPWPNRQLLVVPMAGGPADLADQVRRLVAGTTVSATTTARVPDPQAAWAHIGTAWSVVRRGRAGWVAAEPASTTSWPSGTIATAGPTTPMAAPKPRPTVAEPERLQRYAAACAALRGTTDVCIFRIVDRRPLAHAGGSADPHGLAIQGASLLASALGAAGPRGGVPAVVETLVTLGDTVLLARLMPRHPGVGLLAVVERHAADPVRLGAQLQRLEALLDAH